MKPTMEEKKTEAIKRMKLLDLYQPHIDAFIKKGTVSLSEQSGAMFWLEKNGFEECEKAVKDFKMKHPNHLVYFTQLCKTALGTMLSIFSISDYKEEWDFETDELQDGFPIVYVANLDVEDFSEWGSIGIRSRFGGVVRVA